MSGVFGVEVELLDLGFVFGGEVGGVGMEHAVELAVGVAGEGMIDLFGDEDIAVIYESLAGFSFVDVEAIGEPEQ